MYMYIHMQEVPQVQLIYVRNSTSFLSQSYTIVIVRGLSIIDFTSVPICIFYINWCHITRQEFFSIVSNQCSCYTQRSYAWVWKFILEYFLLCCYNIKQKSIRLHYTSNKCLINFFFLFFVDVDIRYLDFYIWEIFQSTFRAFHQFHYTYLIKKIK